MNFPRPCLRLGLAVFITLPFLLLSTVTQAEWPHPLNLPDIGSNGVDGIFIDTSQRISYLGSSVHGVGDINGDGIDDLMVGAAAASTDGDLEFANKGEVYFIYGRSDWTAHEGSFQVMTITPESGVRIIGNMAGAHIGFYISHLGDFDGDRLNDVIINAYPQAFPSDQRDFLIFGTIGTHSITGILDLALMNSSTGMIFDQTLVNVGCAGDVNADGYDDVIIQQSARVYYLVYGGHSWRSDDNIVTFADLNSSNSVIINYPSNATVAYSRAQSGLGDVNGDGIDDFAITNPYNAGKTYVIYGSKTGIGTNGVLELATLDADHGLVINGTLSTGNADYLGGSVASAGDVNGDGIQDIIIGAAIEGTAYNGGIGRAYLIWGKDGGLSATGIMNMSSLNISQGVAIQSEVIKTDFGFRVSNAGDQDFDGLTDVIISAQAMLENAGRIYMIYGKNLNGLPTPAFQASSLNGSNGLYMNGTKANNTGLTGYSLSNAGDVNGDGAHDIIIGSPGFYPGFPDRGRAYVVFGSDHFTSPVYHATAPAGITPWIGVGQSGDRRFSVPLSRAALKFDDGQGPVFQSASKQSVQLINLNTANFAIDPQPTTTTARIMWHLSTNRTDWTQASVRLYYLESYLGGIAEASLVVLTAETLDGPWELVYPQQVHVSRNYVEFQTGQLGYFILGNLHDIGISPGLYLTSVKERTKRGTAGTAYNY